MAYAEVDDVSAHFFDRKFQPEAVKTACAVAKKALQAVFDLGSPKDKHARYWSVDLKLTVTLDSKTQELNAGCGVLVSIKQDGKKSMHASKPPNSAKGKVNTAKLEQKDVDNMVTEAVVAAMEKPIALMKADSKNL